VMIKRSCIFRDTMPHSPMKVNHCFWETRHLHLQSQRIFQARHQHEANSKLCFMLVSSLAYSLRRRWRPYIPQKWWLTFIGLQALIPQKIVLFIIAFVWKKMYLWWISV
jgi:hypothetical protein